jgi:hypothetical protein
MNVTKFHHSMTTKIFVWRLYMELLLLRIVPSDLEGVARKTFTDGNKRVALKLWEGQDPTQSLSGNSCK